MQVDTPPVTVVETREQRRERRKKERSEQVSACHSSPFFHLANSDSMSCLKKLSEQVSTFHSSLYKLCVVDFPNILFLQGCIQTGARDCTLGPQRGS